MYHNVFRYAYLTFQTQNHLYKQYIVDTSIIQSEYAFLFPFSIHIGSRLFELFSKEVCVEKPPKKSLMAVKPNISQKPG